MKVGKIGIECMGMSFMSRFGQVRSDGIEDGITKELVERGVPKEDIVLAFHSPEIRQYTGYALA
jgi:XisI protein